MRFEANQVDLIQTARQATDVLEESICKLVRDTRMSRALSQDELCAKVGKVREELSKLENRRCGGLKFSTINRWLHGCGYTLTIGIKEIEK